MTLEFLGKDPESADRNSPTVWIDGNDYVLQGFRINDLETLSQIGEVPPHEVVMRFPRRMMPFFLEVPDGGKSDV